MPKVRERNEETTVLVKDDLESMPTLEEGDEGERMARVRILRAQADQKEMELAKLRSQLVTVPDVERLTADFERVTAARIMAIPARVAPELVGETSRVMIQAKLDKAVKAALHDLAKSLGGGTSAGEGILN